MDRASAFGADGWEFKSLRAHSRNLAVDPAVSLRMLISLARNTRLPTVRRAHRGHFPQLLPRAIPMMRMLAVDCNPFNA